jgi:uroporphyrinogen decarboxylase
MINPKENAFRVLRFDAPEYVMTGLPGRRIVYRGCNHEGYDGGGHDCPVGTRWTDIWGVTWEKHQEGVMGFPVGHPLAEMCDLDDHPWPDPDDGRITGPIAEGAAGFDGEEGFLVGCHRDLLWERAHMMLGTERAMTAMLEDPAFMHAFFRRVADFHLAIAGHYVRAGVEVASFAEDLGAQTGPLLGPRLVDAFLVPGYRRIFGFYKSRGVLVSLHSCGCIESLLDTFMDLGVDVLNPVQATANDLDLVRRRTQGKMALEGAVSTAIVMAGPPERIRDEVRRRMWQLGREGGYFCCPDQGMPFPAGHREALEEAVAEFGVYPLEDPDA